MPTQPSESAPTPAAPAPAGGGSPRDRRWLILLSWLWVGLPLAYGVYELVQKAAQLFTG
ncbi:hypothetical protein GCM10018793_40700 [Streptomyces sulfonofaciens]|uniref:Uncharacterized protein n=1 Tax=Streptomyces sulfonofaciens TaxID=68272 RepID=A0A919GCK9_9ACTN|nr:hypothetical protein [Streptomyces sulfonofaciens]GHH82009.1 hypothetical protein GCM10018793_40700 [Streptomyces sulfonofaciens]